MAIRCDKCNSSVLQYEWQDALDDLRVIDQRHDAHLVMTSGTQQRINLPDFLDQLAPRSRWNAPRFERGMLDDCNYRAYFGAVPLLCCCRGLARSLLLCLLCKLPAPATHLVEIPAVVTHHLEALVWNVLRDGDEDWRDEITRAEYLKVALNLRNHSRRIVGGSKEDQDIWNGLKMPMKS